MIRDWWRRRMDARGVLSVALAVPAYGLMIVGLAVTPGFLVSGGLGPGWLAPAVGGASGTAMRGYFLHRRPGTRDGLRWAVVQGGLMLLVILGMFALAALIRPVASSNPTLGGDAWLGLLAVGAVVAMVADVLWQRNRQRRRIAAIMLVAVCLIVAGGVGVRTGGPGTPIGASLLVTGVLGVAAAALLGLSHLLRVTSDPARGT